MTRAHEIGIKRERVRRFLIEHGLDGVLMTQQSSFSWYTGGGNGFVGLASVEAVGSVLAMRDRDVLITNSIEAPRLEAEEIGGLDVETLSFPWHRPEEGAKIVEKFGRGKRIATDVALGDAFRRLRYVLTESEIERYRALGNDAGASLAAVCRAFLPGDSEFQIAGQLAESLFSKEITPIVLLVAADDRVSRFRHPIPTSKQVDRYAMAVLCGRRGGLIVSATRLVHFGNLSPELRRKHASVTRIDAAVLAHTRPGNKVRAVFEKAVTAYRTEGFEDEWKRHHQGGGTGYEAREFLGTADCSEIVQAHQAYAWNPSITGTKSEDTILVGTEGFEVLTKTPDWPMVAVEVAGQTLSRPDILIR
ncbi:MAG: M24 family metallopeptidase [Candidatus Latescibacterota bacterium]